MEEGGEEEWTIVRGKKWRQRGLSFGKGGRDSMVTFYFTNFPESWGVEPLWKMFTRWGKVVDVYLPKKRNKEGKLFGFVRFDQVL